MRVITYLQVLLLTTSIAILLAVSASPIVHKHNGVSVVKTTAPVAVASKSRSSNVVTPQIIDLADNHVFRGSLPASASEDSASFETKTFSFKCSYETTQGLSVRFWNTHSKAAGMKNFTLFVAANRVATPNNYDWNSTACHKDNVNIPSTDAKWPKKTDSAFYITLQGPAASYFSIAASCSGLDHTQMINHKAAVEKDRVCKEMDSLKQKQDEYVTKETTHKVKLIKHIERTQKQLIERTDQEESTDHKKEVVASKAEKKTSIRGVEFNTYLPEGVPISGSATSTQGSFYTFNNGQANCNLSFSLTPFTGDPDLYISTTVENPNSGNAQWRSTRFGADRVDITNAATGSYYVGVYGFPFNGSISATFSVLVQRSCSNVVDYVYIADGLPQTNYANDSSTFYYQFYFSSGAGVEFNLQAEFGDADLYITNVAGSTPSSTNYMWRGIHFGSDSVTVNNSDPHFCSGCTYYIAVKIFLAPCRFTLVVTGTQDFTMLVEGVPIIDSVLTQSYKYYSLPPLEFGVQSALTFTLTSFSGDPDMYISTTVQRPSTTNYTWKSVRFGSDAITLSPSEICFDCTYFIAVHGWSNSSYSLVANWAEPIELLEGIPEFGEVPATGYDYYYLEEPFEAERNITLNVQSISGITSVFVSFTNYPSRNNYTLYSFWRAAHSITITLTSSVCDPSSELCGVYIAVYGELSSNYTIITASDSTEIALEETVPQDGAIAAGSYDYYSFESSSSGDTLTITVTCLVGDADIYMNSPGNSNTRPNRTSYDYYSSHFGNDSIVIESSAIGTYYIAIYGFTHSLYTILVERSGGSSPTPTPSQLIDGYPQAGVVSANQYSMFYFFAFSQTDLYITLSVDTGSATAYINNNGQYPSRSNFQWQTTSHLQIRGASPSLFIFAVYGTSASYFTLTVSTTQVPTYLEVGVPYLDTITDYNTYHYYQFYNYDDSQTVTITVTPQSGDPDLYVSTTREFPNTTYYSWRSITYTNETVIVTPTTDGHCACYYYLSILNMSPSTTYTITVNIGDSADRLFDSEPQQGFVLTNQYHYYFFDVINPSADLKITCIVDVGQLSVFVSTTDQTPGTSNYTWADQSANDRKSVVIPHTDPHFCDCRFYISVYGVASSVYTLQVVDDL